MGLHSQYATIKTTTGERENASENESKRNGNISISVRRLDDTGQI